MGVHCWGAPIRSDLVVQIAIRLAPFPGGHDHVALYALWARRLALRQLAFGDAIGPLAEILERRAAKVASELVGHLLAGLPRLDATHPGLFARLEVTELRRDRTGRLLAELVAADAANVLHLLEPVDLGELLGNVALAAELALIRDLHHRVPVDRRIVMRCLRLVWRRNRLEVELLARLGAQLGRVYEPVAAHPDAVVRGRKVWDHVPP